MKAKNLKHERNKSPAEFKFLTEILKRRLKMRMKLIKHRRSFMRNQLQQSFQLFQNSVLTLFKNLTYELLQIILQNLKLHNNSKSTIIIKNKLENKLNYIENIDETNKEIFLKHYHITSDLFHDICEIWPQTKYHNTTRHLLRKIANCSKDDGLPSKNSFEILKSEENICSDIINHFEYTCNPMTIYECEEAKQKFHSLCGIKISGILVDFKFDSVSIKNYRMFAILDHKKRFRSLAAKKLPAFLTDVEMAQKKKSSYFFSDVPDSRHEKSILYCDNIGKDPCEKLINFKQEAINEVFNRWTYLNREKYSSDIFKTCIILHNLCKNKSISMPSKG